MAHFAFTPPDRPPEYAVERRIADPDAWCVFVVDVNGGVGIRAAGPFPSRPQAEAWAQAYGRLAEPCVEAA